MNLNKIVSPVLAVAIAAGSLVPLSSAANAGDRWGHHGGGHHANRYDNGGDRQVDRWGQPRQNPYADYSYRRKHDHTGRNVAIGVFATILGLALASEAARVEHDYYRD